MINQLSLKLLFQMVNLNKGFEVFIRLFKIVREDKELCEEDD